MPLCWRARDSPWCGNRSVRVCYAHTRIVITMNKTESHWELYPHEADMGVRGIGPSLEEAFAQAGIALTAVITDPETVVARERVRIELDETDLELLLVDFLNALIYEMATRHMLFGHFDVNMAGGLLTVTAGGEVIDVARHQPGVEVKGATYTDLAVRRDEHGRWIAQCVVDV